MKLQNLIQDLADNDRTLTALSKGPRWNGRRNFSPLMRKSISEYATLVGEVTWASNTLHNTLAMIFIRLVDPHAMAVGFGIWNSVKADSGQRDMLKAAAQESAQMKLITVGEQIKWLCDASGRVSAYRNDAVHTPMRMVVDGSGSWVIKPLFNAPESRVERLAAGRYAPLFRLLRGDLIELGRYASALYERVAVDQYGMARPRLPKQPELQSHAFLTQGLAPKPQHMGQKKGHRPRRPKPLG